MPIIINELHTELTEPTPAEAAAETAPAGDTAPAALEPDFAMQRAAALLAERQARLQDD
jgi:hypothetical protein